MSRWMLGVSIVLAALAANFLSSREVWAQQKYTMKVGGVLTGEKTGWYVGLRAFKQKVEPMTGGRLDVQIYMGTLGGERQLYEGLRLGTIEGAVANTGPLSAFVPEVGLLNLPFLFTSWQHAWKVVDGPLGKKLADKTLEKGIRVLGWWQIGTRDIYNNGRPIMKPEDLKGMKIRTMESPEFLAMYRAYGAMPVPMPQTETYMALKQGVIDGADSPLGAVAPLKHNEVVKYAARIQHLFSISPLCVSEKWFGSLPPDIQEAIVKAEQQVRQLHREADIQQDDGGVKEFEAAGVKVTFPDRKAFQVIGRSIYPQFYNQVGRENIEMILKTGE